MSNLCLKSKCNLKNLNHFYYAFLILNNTKIVNLNDLVIFFATIKIIIQKHIGLNEVNEFLNYTFNFLAFYPIYVPCGHLLGKG